MKQSQNYRETQNFQTAKVRDSKTQRKAKANSRNEKAKVKRQKRKAIAEANTNFTNGHEFNCRAYSANRGFPNWSLGNR
mgnify:CR=1 FL=1